MNELRVRLPTNNDTGKIKEMVPIFIRLCVNYELSSKFVTAFSRNNLLILALHEAHTLYIQS